MEPATGAVRKRAQTLGGLRDVSEATGDGAAGVVVVDVEEDDVQVEVGAAAALLQVRRTHFLRLIGHAAREEVHAIDVCKKTSLGSGKLRRND